MKISVTMEFEGADAMERASRWLFPQKNVAHQIKIEVPKAELLDAEEAAAPPKKAARKKAEVTAGAAKVTEALDAAVPPAKPEEPLIVGVEAVEKALDRLFDAKGLEVARGVMARFGVKRGRELKPEQYSDFVKKCDAVVAGGEV